MLQYILDEYGNPVLEFNAVKWAEWFETADRHIAQDIFGDVKVSTVFLGLDHSFNDGVPILYETMIFGGEHNDYQERYATKEQALAGHAKAVALVLNN